MTQENILGSEQEQAESVAESEAKELEKAEAALSDLLDQIEQAKGYAEEVQFMMDLLGDEARNAANSYGVEDNIDEAQRALNSALAGVKASLALLEFGEDFDEADEDADEIDEGV
jgi:hypothetical protein